VAYALSTGIKIKTMDDIERRLSRSNCQNLEWSAYISAAGIALVYVC